MWASPSEGIRVDPDGWIWVERVRALEAPRRIDLFSPDGRYRGTLPEGFEFPTAFQSGDRFVTFKLNSDGVPYVVAYEVKRAPG